MRLKAFLKGRSDCPETEPVAPVTRRRSSLLASATKFSEKAIVEVVAHVARTPAKKQTSVPSIVEPKSQLFVSIHAVEESTLGSSTPASTFSTSSTYLLPSPACIMTTTPPTVNGREAPLSLMVLLPATAHMPHQPAPILPVSRPMRPSPLESRQSGSSIQTLNSLRMSPSAKSKPSFQEEDDQVDMNLIMASRRLSLAPGIGAGTQTRSPPITSLSTIMDAPAPIPDRRKPTFGTISPFSQARPSPVAGSVEAPAFGAKKEPIRGRKRPQTAATAFNTFARGSIAVPSAMGLGLGMNSKSRPGWEGDEIVGVLRSSGQEVTVIRNTSHLPAVLSSSNSPSLPSLAKQSQTSNSTTPPSSVILVPLCDSPTLPSLSLLLSQGTTPTAVCFQQDLLDRAKRTEDEWLPSALQQIKTVIEMRDRASSPFDPPVILAYSANPALSTSTIAACVGAGAGGVLKPPYDLETAKLVRRMVQAVKESRISSVVGMPSRNSLAAAMDYEDAGPQVILPPAALNIGNRERDSERALSAAGSNHRRGTSVHFDSRGPSPLGGRSRVGSSTHLNGSNPSSRRPSDLEPLRTASPVEDEDAFPHSPSFEHYASSPAYTERRRSVDIGGLTVAMKRAQKAFETPQKEVASRANGTHSKAQEQSVGEEEAHTQLAELLGAMYYQTNICIDVQMAEFKELSAPLSMQHRGRLVDALATWDFQPHQLDQGDLFRAACLVFEGILSIEGLAGLALERDRVNRLLFAIRAIYHAPNPYHNYIHAIDVLQATYTFLLNMGVVPPWSYYRDWTPSKPAWKRPDESVHPVHGLGTRRARAVFRPQDVLAVLVAAMGHDIGHPGLSNAFMKNAKTPLSQVYDDKSSLENMHCLLVTQLLKKHGLGFLVGQCPGSTINAARRAFDAKAFRKILYSSVLATDMSLHFAWIARLKEFGEAIENQGDAIWEGAKGVQREEDDRIMICQALIKCADISNPTRPIDVSEHWSSVLLAEWAAQASLEQALNLPVSVIGSADAALQAKGQIGFIDLFTQPLFEAVSDVLPELQRYAEWCSGNRALWQARLEELSHLQGAMPVIQPAVDSGATDPRFTTLFPLSLPSVLVDHSSLDAGPPSPVQPARGTVPNGDAVTCYCPATKAIRAVYYANLLEKKKSPLQHLAARKVWLNDGRRASYPELPLLAHAATVPQARG